MLTSGEFIIFHFLLRDIVITMATPSKDQAEVILVGCGCPLRGMGWYHAVQMLGNECPSAKLCHIVEGWFMGGGASGALL